MSKAGASRMVLLPPWVDTASREPVLTAELHRELGPGHVLFGKDVRVLARREDSDDVLIEVAGENASFAVVHLTWTGKQEQQSQWPQTELYASLEEWESLRMRPDHRDYTAAQLQ